MVGQCKDSCTRTALYRVVSAEERLAASETSSRQESQRLQAELEKCVSCHLPYTLSLSLRQPASFCALPSTTGPCI